MSTVRLEEVQKVYDGDVVAVNGIDLTVDDGELVALLGPSGCGKTTTLKIVAGLEAVTKGAVYFDDRAVTEEPPERRDIAMVFEDYALYHRMSVRDNIAFPLKVRRVARRERDQRVREMLELLELGDVAGVPPTELSGGQQQRVAIARALVREPAVLLLDEPLSHLDTHLKRTLREQMKWLQKQRHVTAVLVTHDQEEAMALADRVAVMNEGEIHQFATTKDLCLAPATTFVAGFVGSPAMNLLPARIETENDHPYLRLEGLRIALPSRVFAALPATGSTSYIAGIRPEHVELRDASHPGDGTGDVFFAEWNGDQTTVLLSHPGSDDHWLTVVGSADLTVRIGDRVAVKVANEQIHLFDADTGRRVGVPERTLVDGTPSGTALDGGR